MIYDRFQQEAIDSINAGHSVLVSAPTGAGKTVIAEHVIIDCITKNKKVIYTAPIKALSNQKFRDFQEKFPDKTGILTGDVSINSHAPVLIMTTEIFRNKVLEENSGMEEYSWIIFDEIHYLDDYERGTVWEESLMFLPEHMRVLALSATIPNIDQLAGWIKDIHIKDLTVIKEEARPVPLHFFYQCQGEVADNFNKLKSLGLSNALPRAYPRGRALPHQKNLRPNKIGPLMDHLGQNDRLPCLYFAFGRRRCEYLAEDMHSFSFLDQEERKKISDLFFSLCDRFDITNQKSAAQMLPYIQRGIAYHHAGMLPTLKEVIERLFTSGLIKVIFTTETFALGINMPARTVVFDELRKFYGRGFSDLKTRDFYQMAGRAGRRGMDKEGFVYTRVNPHQITASRLHRIIFGEPEQVKSKFNTSYATLLNLYEKYGEKLYDIYPLTFHYFQEKNQSRKKALFSLRSKILLLKDLGCIRKNVLTEKGRFASKIYGYELPLSELYDQGILTTLSPIELGILTLSLVFEPRKGTAFPRLDKRTKRLRSITDKIAASIHRKEERLGISPLSKSFYFHLSSCLEAWMRGAAFENILTETDADEGEIIRCFRMCTQNLREILDTPVSRELRETAKKALVLINRDIIDAEKQLRQ
ncbi:MAG: DEAD/DEAH box helicase [Candidatus Omnitrophota bacterium]